jgi:hypothetical protein
MMQALLDGKLGLGLLAGLGSLAGAGAAGAAQYACRVPLAVLCQGCAGDVTIALQPRGGCRVSFSPAPGGAVQPVSGAITLQIQTPSAQFTRRGASSRQRSAAKPLQPSRGACFVFNDRQYCE